MNSIFNTISLGTVYRSKNNNFNLIRLILSVTVILTHCFWVAEGVTKSDPLMKYMHMTLGDLAVLIFFVISGFLISKSYLENQDPIYFIKSRILRIYPAVITVTILTVIMGFYLTQVNYKDYFLSKQVFSFLYKNCLLIFDIRERIGFNIFGSNPLGGQINSPLWTLTWELKMYLLVLFIFSTTKIFHTRIYFNFLFLILSVLYFYFMDKIGRGGNFPLYFFTGVFFYVNRNNIKLNLTFFFSSIIVLFLISGNELDKFLLPIILAYQIIFLAYVNSSKLKTFNRFGDYSFGLYIFSFPIQQLLVYLKITNVPLLFFTSLFISFLFAFTSYHLIESKALSLKSTILKKV